MNRTRCNHSDWHNWHLKLTLAVLLLLSSGGVDALALVVDEDHVSGLARLGLELALAVVGLAVGAADGRVHGRAEGWAAGAGWD